MPPRAQVPSQLRGRIFRGSSAVRAGVLTARRLDGPTWRRLFPDVYVHRDIPYTHELRAVAAAGVYLPGSVVSGVSAAVVWGVDLAGDDDPVELTVPPEHHAVRVSGLRVRRARLPEDWICRRSGVRITTPEATALRVAAALPLDDAVVAVEPHGGVQDRGSAGGPGAGRRRKDPRSGSRTSGVRARRRSCGVTA